MEAKDIDKIADLLFRRKYTELIVSEQLRLGQIIDFIEAKSFKAGRKEVVEWVEDKGIAPQIHAKESTPRSQCLKCQWQNFKKEKGL